MDRRDFITGLFSLDLMNEVVATRKYEGTLPVQIELIKVIYKLSLRLRSIMYLHIPYQWPDGDYWYSSTRLHIFNMGDDHCLIEMNEHTSSYEQHFTWIHGNMVVFKDLPEVINFHGHYFPIMELFRLEIPDTKIPIVDEEGVG